MVIIEPEIVEETPDDEAKPVNNFTHFKEDGCITEEVADSTVESTMVNFVAADRDVIVAFTETTQMSKEGNNDAEKDDDDGENDEMPGLIDVDDDEPIVKRVNMDGCFFKGENKK